MVVFTNHNATTCIFRGCFCDSLLRLGHYPAKVFTINAGSQYLCLNLVEILERGFCAHLYGAACQCHKRAYQRGSTCYLCGAEKDFVKQHSYRKRHQLLNNHFYHALGLVNRLPCNRDSDTDTLRRSGQFRHRNFGVGQCHALALYRCLHSFVGWPNVVTSQTGRHRQTDFIQNQPLYQRV